MTNFAIFGVVHSAALYLAVGLCASQAMAADDIATLFDENFEGISLTLTDPDQVLARRPRAAELAVDSLPGFRMTSEELSLVLRITDPVGSGGLAADDDAVELSLRERLVSWMTQHSNESNDKGVFSALSREADEPGVRVDIDTDAEEVRLEYRVGF